MCHQAMDLILQWDLRIESIFYKKQVLLGELLMIRSCDNLLLMFDLKCFIRYVSVLIKF